MHYRPVIDSIVDLQPFITASGNDDDDDGNNEHYKGPSNNSHYNTGRSTGLPSRLGSLPISVSQAHPDMQDENRVLGNMLYI
jgi:hypothetical protein